MTYSTSSDISVSRLRDLRDSNSIVLSPAILEHDDSLSVFSETSFTGPKSETRTSDKVSAWLKPPEERKHNQDHRHYTKTREKTISSEPKISYRSFHTANQEAVSYTNGVDIPGPRHMVTRAQNTRGHEAPRGYSQPSASSFIQGERMITVSRSRTKLVHHSNEDITQYNNLTLNVLGSNLRLATV